jgi:hypothetical protein
MVALVSYTTDIDKNLRQIIIKATTLGLFVIHVMGPVLRSEGAGCNDDGCTLLVRLVEGSLGVAVTAFRLHLLQPL